jgi:hypothetical protein
MHCSRQQAEQAHTAAGTVLQQTAGRQAGTQQQEHTAAGTQQQQAAGTQQQQAASTHCSSNRQAGTNQCNAVIAGSLKASSCLCVFGEQTCTLQQAAGMVGSEQISSRVQQATSSRQHNINREPPLFLYPTDPCPHYCCCCGCCCCRLCRWTAILTTYLTPPSSPTHPPTPTPTPHTLVPRPPSHTPHRTHTQLAGATGGAGEANGMEVDGQPAPSTSGRKLFVGSQELGYSRPHMEVRQYSRQYSTCGSRCSSTALQTVCMLQYSKTAL